MLRKPYLSQIHVKPWHINSQLFMLHIKKMLSCYWWMAVRKLTESPCKMLCSLVVHTAHTPLLYREAHEIPSNIILFHIFFSVFNCRIIFYLSLKSICTFQQPVKIPPNMSMHTNDYSVKNFNLLNLDRHSFL